MVWAEPLRQYPWLASEATCRAALATILPSSRIARKPFLGSSGRESELGHGLPVIKIIAAKQGLVVGHSAGDVE